MPVSAETLSLLMSKGLAGDDLLEVVRAIDADDGNHPVRTLRQERNKRYYDSKKAKRESSENVLIKTSEQDAVSDGVEQKERTKEKVIYNKPLSQEASPPSIAPQAETKRTRRKTTLDPEAQPTAADKEFAEKAGMNVATMRVQWPDFRLHHCSRGNRMLDWHLAWCTWVRGWQKGYGQPRAGPAVPRRHGHLEAHENHLSQFHEPDRSTQDEHNLDSPAPRLRFADEHHGDHGEPPGDQGRRFVLAGGGHAEPRSKGQDAFSIGDLASGYARRWN